MERQMTLAEINDELGAARTNKKEFLEKLAASFVVEKKGTQPLSPELN